MPLTRAEAKAALKHVINTVLAQPDDGAIAKTLEAEGFSECVDIVSADEALFKTLEYNDGGTTKTLTALHNQDTNCSASPSSCPLSTLCKTP